MQLGCQSVPTSTDTSVSSLFLGGSLLMNAHDAEVNHLHLAVVGLDDGVHQLVPNARFPPWVEAVVHRRGGHIVQANRAHGEPDRKIQKILGEGVGAALLTKMV